MRPPCLSRALDAFSTQPPRIRPTVASEEGPLGGQRASGVCWPGMVRDPLLGRRPDGPSIASESIRKISQRSTPDDFGWPHSVGRRPEKPSGGHPRPTTPDEAMAAGAPTSECTPPALPMYRGSSARCSYPAPADLSRHREAPRIVTSAREPRPTGSSGHSKHRPLTSGTRVRLPLGSPIHSYTEGRTLSLSAIAASLSERPGSRLVHAVGRFSTCSNVRKIQQELKN
jgi:hypothetical protein